MSEDIETEIYYLKSKARRTMDGRTLYSESLLLSVGIDFATALDFALDHGGYQEPDPVRGVSLRAGQMVKRVQDLPERQIYIPDEATGGASA